MPPGKQENITETLLCSSKKASLCSHRHHNPGISATPTANSETEMLLTAATQHLDHHIQVDDIPRLCVSVSINRRPRELLRLL